MADIVKLIYKGDEMAQWGGSGSTPQATTSTIGTVRVATYAEAKAHVSDTWSQWEYLMTPLGYVNDAWIYYYWSDISSSTATGKWTTVTMQIPAHRWLVPIRWRHQFINWVEVNKLTVSWWWATYKVAGTTRNASWTESFIEDVTELYFVHGWSSEPFTVSLEMLDNSYDFASVDSKAKRFTAWNWFPVAFHEDGQ